MTIYNVHNKNFIYFQPTLKRRRSGSTSPPWKPWRPSRWGDWCPASVTRQAWRHTSVTSAATRSATWALWRPARLRTWPRWLPRRPRLPWSSGNPRGWLTRWRLWWRWTTQMSPSIPRFLKYIYIQTKIYFF